MNLANDPAGAHESPRPLWSVRKLAPGARERHPLDVATGRSGVATTVTTMRSPHRTRSRRPLTTARGRRPRVLRGQHTPWTASWARLGASAAQLRGGSEATPTQLRGGPGATQGLLCERPSRLRGGSGAVPGVAAVHTGPAPWACVGAPRPTPNSLPGGSAAAPAGSSAAPGRLRGLRRGAQHYSGSAPGRFWGGSGAACRRLSGLYRGLRSDSGATPGRLRGDVKAMPGAPWSRRGR